MKNPELLRRLSIFGALSLTGTLTTVPSRFTSIKAPGLIEATIFAALVLSID